MSRVSGTFGQCREHRRFPEPELTVLISLHRHTRTVLSLLSVYFYAKGLHVGLLRTTSPSHQTGFSILVYPAFCKDSDTNYKLFRWVLLAVGDTLIEDLHAPNFQVTSLKEPDYFDTISMTTYATNYTSRSSTVSYGRLSRSMPADYLRAYSHVPLAEIPQAPLFLASVPLWCHPFTTCVMLRTWAGESLRDGCRNTERDVH